jgi:hypothetical protein
MVLRKRPLYPKDFLTGGFEVFALKAHHKQKNSPERKKSASGRRS